MMKIFIIPSQFMAWQPVILEYLNQCLRLTTFGEKHRTTLEDMYFHLMTSNMEFSEVTILFFYACDTVTMIITMMTVIIVLEQPWIFFFRKSSHLENFQLAKQEIASVTICR